MSKCDNCMQQFVCTSEDGECDSGKEKYIELEQDVPLEFNCETEGD